MTTKRRPRRERFACPNCGADVSIGAKACRECGSDATTGWQDDDAIGYAQVDLPDGYRDEGGDEAPPAKTAPWVRWTALLVVAAMVATIVVMAWQRRA